MKHILVIGGSYFAGRVFVETLFRTGQYKIYVFNRGNLPMGIEGVEQIIGDRDIPANIAQGISNRHWDAVVDFCAYTPEHITNLLHSIPGTIGHYIFISTTSVYAPSQKVPIGEDFPKVVGPQPELGEFADYGYLKWLAEGSCEKECQQKNIPFTILRPAIIYGRYNYAPRESFFFDHVIANKPLVIPENDRIYYSFVWVDDLGEIIAACLENEVLYGKAFNVAGEEFISYAVMADTIEEVCGRNIQRKVMSTEDIIREKAPMPFPPDDHLLYDGSRLHKELNFVHTPFVLGIAKTWQDYQKVVQRRIEAQGKS